MFGSGYDLSTTSYSPEGRLFQVEFATKSVKNSGTAIGICCTDGVVFGVENIRLNKLLEKESNSQIYTPDKHIGVCTAGWEPDSMAIAKKASVEAKEYKDFYGSNIPTYLLNEKLSAHVHLYTCYGWMRPYGSAAMLGGITNGKPELFLIMPSGEGWGYHATAIGKGQQAARSELEKLKLKEMKCKDAVKEIARIIWKIHDFLKDKEFNLEMTWVCEDSKNLHKEVPEDIKKEAIEYAKKMKKKGDEDDDDDDDDDEKMKEKEG